MSERSNPFHAFLKRLLPFMALVRRRSRGDSDRTFQRMAKEAEHRALDRKHRLQHGHVPLAVPSRLPGGARAPSAPVRHHGIWETKEQQTPARTWFFSRLHLPFFAGRSSEAPPAQTQTSSPPATPMPPPENHGLDDLLTDMNAKQQGELVKPDKQLKAPVVMEKQAKENREQRAEVQPEPEITVKPLHTRPSGLQEFLGSLNSIGLGHQKMAFIANLATMLGAGLPLVDSLKTLQADLRSGGMRKLLQKIIDDVENGIPLWRAMENRHCFTADALALVRIGEESGNLAENMAYLAIQQEKDQALRTKVRMAMIYPSIVLVLMLVIVIGLGTFVLPNLITVLYTLNVPLPLVTRMVIAFTEFFTAHGPVAIPSFLGGLLAVAILAKFTPLKAVAQWMLFQIPGIGRLAREATIARFGVILGGLLKAGVPLVEALRSLVEVTSMVSYRRFYTKLLSHIVIGDSFGKSFAAIPGSTRLIPLSMQQLVTTGERSGSLSEILLKVADIYEKKANDTAQKLPVILEPILLLIIGAMVGTIAFAIIVPIYSIVGNVAN